MSVVFAIKTTLIPSTPIVFETYSIMYDYYRTQFIFSFNVQTSSNLFSSLVWVDETNGAIKRIYDDDKPPRHHAED